MDYQRPTIEDVPFDFVDPESILYESDESAPFAAEPQQDAFDDDAYQAALERSRRERGF